MEALMPTGYTIISGDFHFPDPKAEKAFNAAVANAALFYQYCAPWGNVAKNIRTVNDLMAASGFPEVITLDYFEKVMQAQHGKCFIERLVEVIAEKLDDSYRQLEKVQFSEDAFALQIAMDAPYLQGVMREFDTGLSFRLRLFHGAVMRKVHDLPSKASMPVKQAKMGYKVRQR
jgi:hypothetical protein